MTVSTTTAKSGPYAGSGTTGPFTVGFRFLENSHILVVKNVAGVETNLVLDTDYTVTGAGASSGSVTLATALATGQTLTIVRNVPTTQETDYVAGDSFPAESHERALDQLTMIAQQLKEEVDRSAKLPVSSTADADALVADIVRLADSADEVDAVAGIEASVVAVAGIDSEVATVAGIAANVTTVAGISTNVTTVAGISSNVTTVAGVAANVTTVAGVSSSVTTVAGISAAVSTVAADGTDIGAVAAISADVQAVADIATDVSAVENIAANVTTVAGISANVTTVAGIAANVTAVAGNATNINAVAANETNIDAVAGNATNINAVAADATDIGVVATNIAAVSTVATDIASVNSAAANMAAILDAPAQASAAAASAAAAAAFDPALFLTKSGNLSGLANTATARDNLGVEIGADVQAYDANLTSLANKGLFKKVDATIVAWTKTGAGTATSSTAIYIDVNGSIKTIASGASITMPTLTAGTDYAIWAKTDGTLEATSNHTSPPTANARKVGGFHYAAGSNATGTSGGNTTPQINEYSFWDLKFKPNCADPRGMTLVGGGYWMDIYLTGVDAITNGSSKYNVTMADGSSPPKVPTMFGGNGSTTYGSYTWFEAMEMATAFGKRCPTQREFMSAMYGTTEASSIGTDQGSTILNATYTSKWGVVQSTGVLWIWGDERGGAYATGGWNANTEGRGSEYNAPNAVLLGGYWGGGSLCGSRCSLWYNAASDSNVAFGSRFCCDHLQLD